MRFDNANSAVFHHTDEAEPRTTTINSDRNMTLAQALDLLDAIETGGDTRTPISEGAESLRLVLAVNQSAESGKPVKLREGWQGHGSPRIGAESLPASG